MWRLETLFRPADHGFVVEEAGSGEKQEQMNLSGLPSSENRAGRTGEAHSRRPDAHV
jgi:hypothetical protein